MILNLWTSILVFQTIMFVLRNSHHFSFNTISLIISLPVTIPSHMISISSNPFRSWKAATSACVSFPIKAIKQVFRLYEEFLNDNSFYSVFSWIFLPFFASKPKNFVSIKYFAIFTDIGEIKLYVELMWLLSMTSSF